MAGKVAVLNDLAGFGRCSLTAAISVLSAMGVQPCPLPTAVLSAQTGFESYFFQDLTEQMGKNGRNQARSLTGSLQGLCQTTDRSGK